MFIILYLIILLLIIEIVHAFLYFKPGPRQMPTFPELKRPLFIAHQGGELLAPTNTLASFDNADAIGGADFMDVDVHMTKDGHLVGIHDETVDRTTNGHGRVDAFTLEELQKLDAGYHFKDLHGKYSYRGKGVYVPSIEEVFKRYAEKYYLHFEIKDDYPKGSLSQIEEQLWALIQQYHMEQKTIVSSFKEGVVARFQRISSGQTVVAAGRSEVTQFVLAHWLRHPGFYRRKSNVLEIPHTRKGLNLKDRRLIDGAHRLGMEIYYWTIDDKPTMKEVLELGADGIFTNRPDLLKELLEEMRLRPTSTAQQATPPS